MKRFASSLLYRLAHNPARIAVFLAGLTLSGCAYNADSVDRDFAFTPETDTGLIIGSATLGEGNHWYAASFRFHYSRAGEPDIFGGKGRGFISAFPYNSLMRRTEPSDFKNATGTVFAIPLAPGNYVFDKWDLDNGATAMIHPVNPLPLKFTVRKGEATYIGNLHMHLHAGRTLPGIGVIGSGRPAILDRSERDIPLLLQRYPNIKRQDIDVRIIDDRPWGGKGPPLSIEARLSE